MTTASQDKITVPGDDRLTKLNVSTKTPFWTKIPIIKELRVAVGWQKGMLITGLAITAFFLLVALFAPLIAPYGHAQAEQHAGEDGEQHGHDDGDDGGACAPHHTGEHAVLDQDPDHKELRVAVGWQKGMLITGLAIKIGRAHV